MEQDQVLALIKKYYLELLPFNKVLGIDISDLDFDTGAAVTRFPMAPDLIGNSVAGPSPGLDSRSRSASAARTPSPWRFCLIVVSEGT